MFICKKVCRKCYPNGCCGFCKPPPQVQQQVDTKVFLKQDVEKSETPQGYIEFYSGVRTPDNTYTSPVLAVHLYRHSQFNADINRDNRTVTVDGNNQQGTHQGPKQFKTQEKITAEEDVLMIPVEDVTRIYSKAELKLGVQADVQSHITPIYADSENRCDRCCARIFKCCGQIRDCCCFCCKEPTKISPHVETNTIITRRDSKKFSSYKEEDLPLPEVKEDCCTSCCNRFRCWCCRRKLLVKLTKKTNTVGEKEAERVVTINIEYSKYSNLDSASNARLLSQEQQEAYYKEKFNPNTPLKFYLVNNTEFDSRNFDVKRKQADVLCLTVMHLKAMKNRYPSETQLNEMLSQPQTTTFGDVFNAPVLQLPMDSNKQAISYEEPKRPAIERQPTTTKHDQDTSEED